MQGWLFCRLLRNHKNYPYIYVWRLCHYTIFQSNKQLHVSKITPCHCVFTWGILLVNCVSLLGFAWPVWSAHFTLISSLNFMFCLNLFCRIWMHSLLQLLLISHSLSSLHLLLLQLLRWYFLFICWNIYIKVIQHDSFLLVMNCVAWHAREKLPTAAALTIPIVVTTTRRNHIF